MLRQPWLSDAYQVPNGYLSGTYQVPTTGSSGAYQMPDAIHSVPEESAPNSPGYVHPTVHPTCECYLEGAPGAPGGH
eukprot:gene5251-biopygen797